MSPDELGAAVVNGRRRLQEAEAAWLVVLAEFDRSGGWHLDGHLSCASWLVERCGMARSTAKDRVRVAFELARRPVLRAAFEGGDLSYSKLRAITRITGVDDDTDEVLVKAAEQATAEDLEQVVRHWKLLQEQDKPDRQNRWAKRGIRRGHRWAGLATAEVVMAVEEIERFFSIIDTWAERRSCGAVDVASAESPADPLGTPTWSQRRADALRELVEAGLAHLEAGREVDPERAEVDIVVGYETLVERVGRPGALANGEPVDAHAIRRLACDAGLARVVVKGASEVLDVGRKTRQWNRAQRRAIRFRHGDRCAFPGCGLRITEVHHTAPWSTGGTTDLDAGVPLCWGHHHLVHEMCWTVTYDPHTTTTTFTSPDGRQVTAPARTSLPIAA